MLRTVLLVLLAVLSVAAFAQQTRIERECLGYTTATHYSAEAGRYVGLTTCATWGGLVSR